MKHISFIALLLMFSTAGFASSITGAVSNKTSNKPAAGDDVVLVKLAASMEEEAHAKTDAKGRFTLEFNAGDGSTPHLVRVNHQGVNYFRPAPPGTNSVDLEVYDAAREVAGVTGVADITRVQADGGRMDVVQMWVLKNQSTPPRTKMSAHTFEVTLPQGAEIDSSVAAGPGGMPVSSSPTPLEEKGHYGFVFPLRPGETRFQLTYHLPYSGSFAFSQQPKLPMEDVVVLLPKSMEFQSEGTSFQASHQERGMNVYVAKNVAAGEKLAYSVSGTGEIPREAQENEDQSASANVGGAAADNRPGGGLGAPIDAPDPLHKYRWWLLGGLAAALVAGAFYILGRPAPATASHPSLPPMGGSAVATQTTLVRGGHLVDTLKEELFQLESDRLQDRISPAEYDQTKAALDLIIKRALARHSQGAKA